LFRFASFVNPAIKERSVSLVLWRALKALKDLLSFSAAFF